MSLLETIKDVVITPIHPKGKPIIIAAAVIAVILYLLSGFLGFLGAVGLAFCVYFFRDPQRTSPQSDGCVLATGDGVICNIAQSPLPAELGADDTPYHKISIFLNVFNVHVNRLPVSGEVTRELYIPGKFLNAALDKASTDNERNILTIDTAKGDTIAFVQIAGFVARRIVSQINQGDQAVAGERYGLIKFGSRCDIYIPAHYELLVREGMTCIGGETMLATHKEFDASALTWATS